MAVPVCYIFGAGERTSCAVKPAPSDIVIAADGGFDYINALGLHANVVLGDFDSVTTRRLPPDCIRYPSKKDDTDLVLAVKLGLEKGYSEFVIYGGLGGRLDHTLFLWEQILIFGLLRIALLVFPKTPLKIRSATSVPFFL